MKGVTIIRTRCSYCGPVELDVRDVAVRMCADEDFTTYTFRCPSCQEAEARSAPRAIVEELVSSGVRLVVWRLPSDLGAFRGDPPVTFNDVVALQRLLEVETGLKRPLVRHNN